MNEKTTVVPQIGFYVVTIIDQWGVQTHQVSKKKVCTCGGSARHPCRHIHAVARYLKAGGERAPERRVNGNGNGNGKGTPPNPNTAPVTCPICEVPVVSEKHGRWRCPTEPSHYFHWRAELNGGAVRKFLTQPHPNKVGAYHTMSEQDRDAFLQRAVRRMHTGGYTPYKGGD
jgi:hypothetical protein